MIRVGSLVRSNTNRLGVGKVKEIDGANALVEYFVSVSQRIEQEVPVESLTRAILQEQTRCYSWHPEREEWLIGRVTRKDTNGDYLIDLPNKKGLLAPEKYVNVRCNKPIEDPTEVLIARGQETPFFYDRRSVLVRCLIEQRAVSHGMTGLFSANVDLFPHQVEVVRRVLEDPIQRYLLADEVGLGKTIEAGAILRQFLLDEPDGQALVIVPQQLLEQWRQELENKFYITERVQLISTEEISSVRINAQPEFLIVDEAHHIAAMATASDSSKRNLFEICRQLAHSARSLLLLSATPALNNEQAFLAMLYLLDPVTYHLEDLAGFRDRVRDRQEIGEILFRFVETAPPRILTKSMAMLRNKFANDNRLISFVDLLEENINQQSERERLVRVIRIHISDTYRLHRRMLRNRRKTVQEMDVLLDQSDAIMRVEYDEDERSLAIQEELDEWRIAALSSASLNSDYSQRLQQIFLLLFRASGTWLGILEWVVVTRLSSTINSYLLEDFDTESTQLLIDTPKFSREEEILERLLEIIQISHEYGDRIAHLIQVIGNLNSSHGQRKIVVFTSFSRTCREIFKQLSSSLGEIAIATYQQGQSLDKVKENTQKFRNHPDCFVLVSDSSGEEGHNLQFADWIVHFDIPLSPNRIEQRNGRLNRIGLTHLMQYIVFAGANVQDGLHDAWFLLLQDGFRIFKESIASLQFYVDEKLPKLEKILFQSGVDGIKQTLNIIQSEITQEKDRIDEQNTLDEIDALEDKATEYFQKLDDYDASHKSMQQSVERWLCGTLHFGRNRELWQSDGIVKYFSTYGTLVTSDDIDSRFAAFLDRSMAYNRLKAIKTSDIQLCRIGNGLIDELASYIRWDDRGQAFAMWRHEENWSPEDGMEWVGFRFDYVVETDLSLVEGILQNWQNASIRAIMRRADALFPPAIRTIFLDTQTNTVEDIQLLSILQRPYSDTGQLRDYNLGSRIHILDEFVSRDDWAGLCQNARSRSEILLRERSDFIEYCQSHAERTDRELSDRIQQLQLRLERQNAQNTELSREVEIENSLRQVLVDGIRDPKIRLDSIGFYIVSGRAPSGITEEEDV